MIRRLWKAYLRPVDPHAVDEAQTREIRFFRIIAVVLALTYPSWYFVNQASVESFNEPFLPRLLIGLLGLVGAISTRLFSVVEKQIRAIFYAISLLIGAHMLYLVEANQFNLSYTTDAISTFMLVEFCMPTLAGGILFPAFIVLTSGGIAYLTDSKDAWFFFTLISETMVVAFVIVAARLKNLAEINRTTKAFKQAKIVAEAANEAKSRFLAVMSHEIRTPMNSILGLVELMEQEDMPESQKANLADIHTSADLLLGLVRDLLDLSRIESGRVELERIPFSLHERMRMCLSLVAPQATTKGLHLRYVTRGLPDPLWVIGDPLRLQQSIYNLLTNALKFTEQGWITLVVESVTSDKNHVSLRVGVRDTGIGIPADKLSTIFESFVQADSSTSRRFGGSGLGLAIAYELVGLMGGKLEVMSREGSGSEFFFEIALPRTEAQVLKPGREGESVFLSGDGPTAERTGDGDEPGKGMKILVADDNPVNLKVATAMLQRLGCRVVAVHDGEEAVTTWVDGQTFDLIFMDCLMPVLDGYAATRRIRDLEKARGEGQPIPIIALTANAMQGEREKCHEAGMDDYVSKPVQLARLRSILRQWNNKRHSSKEAPPDTGAVA
jgi:two-component system, sensor histidine kinase